MALGRRSEARQEELFVPHDRLPRSEGHAFYRQLNKLLAESGFDRFVEKLCAPHYRPSGTPGRPSIPPGAYFRMLLVGYFEGIGSQRGIAWRCHDSLSLREFLGVPLTEDAPDHFVHVTANLLLIDLHNTSAIRASCYIRHPAVSFAW